MDKKAHTWWSWKSPVGLGIFLLTAALALAIFVYMLFNLIGTVEQLAHPASAGLSPQEMQQLESQSAPTDSTGSGAASGALGE